MRRYTFKQSGFLDHLLKNLEKKERKASINYQTVSILILNSARSVVLS